jgi:hypothetical protein
MSKQGLLAVLIGLAVVAAVVSGILATTRKNRVELTGEVLKVRSHQVDPEHTLTLIDFRVHNPSTQQFVVRDMEVHVEGPDGRSVSGELFSEADLNTAVGYYKTLGQRYNPGMKRRDRLNSGATTDRSIGVSLPITDDQLQARKSLRLTIHDVDGPTVEIHEKR